MRYSLEKGLVARDMNEMLDIFFNSNRSHRHSNQVQTTDYGYECTVRPWGKTVAADLVFITVIQSPRTLNGSLKCLVY